MTAEITIIPATNEHHGVSVSLMNEKQARVVRVMQSGRDNGTIGYVNRLTGKVGLNGARACPVPAEQIHVAIAPHITMITAQL